MATLSFIVEVFVLCPFFFFGILYVFFKKFSKKQTNLFGKVADITTVILFFSIPALANFFGSYNIGFLVIIVAIVIAIVFTIIEWKTTKEIEIMPLLRKIWRFLFLVLTFIYIAILIGAIIQKIVNLINTI